MQAREKQPWEITNDGEESTTITIYGKGLLAERTNAIDKGARSLTVTDRQGSRRFKYTQIRRIRFLRQVDDDSDEYWTAGLDLVGPEPQIYFVDHKPRATKTRNEYLTLFSSNNDEGSVRSFAQALAMQTGIEPKLK